MKECRIHTTASGIFQLVAVVILAQTLFFKFSGAAESKYIFTALGVEPWGRLVTGGVELVAVVLLLIPRTVTLGALLALGLMTGALGSHLTKLGVVVKDDGGLLFVLAATVFACSAAVLVLRRRQIPVIGPLFAPASELNCPAKGCAH